MTQNINKKRQWAMPDAFLIIFAIILLAALATYLIPSGSFERQMVGNLKKVVPGSFSLHETSSPAGLMDIFMSIPEGLTQSAPIIFLIFLVGGTIAVYEQTRAIDIGINALIRKVKGNYIALILVVGFIFGCLSSLGLSSNAVIAFIPIGIALSKAMKLDAITGVAIVYLGYYAGNAIGVLDPTILGTAQTLAEVPLFSGLVFRLILFIILIAVTLAYICYYAFKLKKNALYLHSIEDSEDVKDASDKQDDMEDIANKPFGIKEQISALIFVGFIGLFIYGAFELKWGIKHLGAIFIMMSALVAMLYRITPNQYIAVFMKGAQSMTYGALVVGLARAVIVILDNANVIDVIVFYTLIPLSQAPEFLDAQLLYLFNLLFNLLVTSGTGQASIVMPIMVPMLDELELTRQTGVLILKLGDGFTNIITPTSGVLMAVLAVARVSWIKWVKFVYPLLLIWIAIGAVAIAIAKMISYGPV